MPSHFYNEIVRYIEYRRKIAVIDKIPRATMLYQDKLEEATVADARGDIVALQSMIRWFNMNAL